MCRVPTHVVAFSLTIDAISGLTYIAVHDCRYLVHCFDYFGRPENPAAPRNASASNTLPSSRTTRV